ncbi:MAG: N-acetyl-gamma-glutamyl-phosphate reductase [Spirochaetales bacterium]|nr:N-acetyl-gamma-glutamyl-phosphate reductase [Spirochaetales bacterium]
MKFKVFVDGQEGTTGLKIHERLSGRADIEMLTIDPVKRKEAQARKELLNEADVAFLCLPDAASRESASLVENDKTVVIDASTAFRTNPGWAYGMPEMKKNQRDIIRKSKRVSVPGCHATGFVLGLGPLVREGIVSPDYPVTCHSITGYSGGGKKLIALYEVERKGQPAMNAPRLYSLGLAHKHLPEMTYHTGISRPPLFTPVLGNFYQGMAVSIPLHSKLLAKKMDARGVHEFLADYYTGEYFVRVMPFEPEAFLDRGHLDPMEANGTNRLDLFVFGHEEQILVTARFDNLGKGASGAAVQNMNIVSGIDEKTGLTV